MTRILAIIIIATISSGALAAPLSSTMQRDAPTTRFYDSRGNSTGSASNYGNQTNFYDARGNHVGTARSEGVR